MPTPSKPAFPDREEYGPITPADAPAEPPTWAAIDRSLAEARYYWIVTVRPEGRPHARAVWGVWRAPRFFFTTSPETVLARNLASNDAAAVHLESAVEVVIVEGRARRAQVQHLEDAALAYARKYSFPMDPGDPGMPYHVLEAETILAWRAQDPRGSAVRWRL